MKFRAEFRRRLERLREVIDWALYNDENNDAQCYGDLFPCFYSVMSYLWSFNKDKDILIK